MMRMPPAGKGHSPPCLGPLSRRSFRAGGKDNGARLERFGLPGAAIPLAAAGPRQNNRVRPGPPEWAFSILSARGSPGRPALIPCRPLQVGNGPSPVASLRPRTLAPAQSISRHWPFPPVVLYPLTSLPSTNLGHRI